jgi:hypothetical protein
MKNEPFVFDQSKFGKRALVSESITRLWQRSLVTAI